MGRWEGWAPAVVGDPAGSRPPRPGLQPPSPSLRDPPGSLGSDAPSPGQGFRGARIWGLRRGTVIQARLCFIFLPLGPLHLPELSAAGRLTRKGLLGCPQPTPAWFPQIQRPPALFGGKIVVPRHLCTVCSSGISYKEEEEEEERRLGFPFTSSSTDPFLSGEFIYNSHHNSLCLEALVALLTDWRLENIALSLTIPKCAVVVFTDLCLRKI